MATLLVAAAATVSPVVTVGASAHPVAPTVVRVAMPQGRPVDVAPSTTAGPAEVQSLLTRETGDADVVGLTFPNRAAADAVSVAVRSKVSGRWGQWTSIGVSDSAPDPATLEASQAHVASEPVGVLGSDQVQVRVRSRNAAVRLDRLVATFVDGGTSAADTSVGTTPAAAARAAVAQPSIVSRSAWGADESLRSCTPTTVSTIKGGVVHHTVNSNTYASGDVPALLRGIYAYHVKGNGWCDVGYNFFVDRFGRLFEGRYGGMARNVVGAQAAGFNSQTFGVASLGNHDPGTSGAVAPPAAQLSAIGRLMAWKGSLNGWSPATSTSYTSAGNSKYSSGTVITLPRVSGHRNFNLTTCPGDLMYNQISSIRSTATATYTGSSVTYTTIAPRTVIETYGRPAETSFTLSGRGFGHGRGMSQYGAQGAALKGLTRDQILAFYYPGTTRSTSLGNPTMRVHLSAVGTGGTQVVYQSGLTVSDGSRTLSLNSTNADGTQRLRWRVVRGTTGLTLQWLEAGTWRNRSGWTALSTPMSFQNATRGTVRVAMPGGTQRDYRRVIRTVRTSTGAMSLNLIPLDEYLRSVVPSEMPASWPRAALEAQAVAARTYALNHRARQPSGSLFDTCDSTSCQVYRGMTGYSTTGTATSYEVAATTAAVTATTGLAVMYGGGPALTEFSSSNGGRTVASSLPYQVSKSDPYDGIPTATATPWTAALSVATIQAAFPTTGTLRALRIDKRDGIGTYGGRITSITVIGASGSSTVSGDTFRSRTKLRSTWWTVTSAPRVSAASFPKDFDGNSLGDVLAVDPGGLLQMLSGTGTQGFASKAIGNGWSSVGLVTNAGAWDGDNRHDVLGRISGTLYAYPGNGRGGFLPRVAVSSGWNAVDVLTGPGDFDGDGRTDLLGRVTATGTLRLHRGNGKGGFASTTTFGSGWNAFRVIAAAGDLTGDGKPDLVALRSSDNALRLYPGTGTGGFATARTISGTFAGYSALMGVGDVSGDGRDDLVARRSSDGALVILVGNDQGALTTGLTVAGTATWAGWTRWTP